METLLRNDDGFIVGFTSVGSKNTDGTFRSFNSALFDVLLQLEKVTDRTGDLGV